MILNEKIDQSSDHTTSTQYPLSVWLVEKLQLFIDE